MASIAESLASRPSKTLVDLARPHFVNGRWHKPDISRRQLAGIRKDFEREGREFPAEEINARFVKEGFLTRHYETKPNKGHKADRVRAVRYVEEFNS